MGPEWQHVRLGDLISIRHGWPFKSELYSFERIGRPIVVSIGNFEYTGGFRFENTTVKEYVGEYPPDYELRPRDILLVMTCQTPGGEILGIPARIPEDGNVYLHNQRLGLVVLKSTKVDPQFLYWLFLSREFNRHLVASASGTKILHTAPSRIESFQFELPPIQVQRNIAHILGSLDNRLAINRRMNETLEAMARALFKSWFVDFDPVRAKAEGGTPTGMDAETAKLFPSEFEESEMGRIPRGWRWCRLSEAAILNPPRRLAKHSIAPYVEMASLPTAGHRPSAWPPREVGSGARFQNGDTLVARITPCLENGKTGFIDFLNEGEVAWGSTEYIVIAPRSPLPSEWGYLLARDATFRGFAAKKMEGTTGRQRISAAVLGLYTVAMPDSRTAERFGHLVTPLFRRMAAGHDEAASLSAIRDALLPRLLSGELTVPAAEATVEALA